MIKDIISHNADAVAGQREMKALRRYFPQCFNAAGEFDMEAFKASLPGGTTLTDETSGFNWLGKKNAEDGGNRKFILVQLPEECKPDSEAAKAGYKTIDQIGMERIKRAARKIKADNPLFAATLASSISRWKSQSRTRCCRWSCLTLRWTTSRR